MLSTHFRVFSRDRIPPRPCLCVCNAIHWTNPSLWPQGSLVAPLQIRSLSLPVRVSNSSLLSTRGRVNKNSSDSFWKQNRFRKLLQKGMAPQKQSFTNESNDSALEKGSHQAAPSPQSHTHPWDGLSEWAGGKSRERGGRMGEEGVHCIKVWTRFNSLTSPPSLRPKNIPSEPQSRDSTRMHMSYIPTPSPP